MKLYKDPYPGGIWKTKNRRVQGETKQSSFHNAHYLQGKVLLSYMFYSSPILSDWFWFTLHANYVRPY